MKNAAACQGAAAAKNLTLAFSPSGRSNPDWPANYPFSAYGYVPGKTFGDYGGEQIAQQVEKGEAAIRGYVKVVGAGNVDGGNVRSIDVANIQFEDLRSSSVKV